MSDIGHAAEPRHGELPDQDAVDLDDGELRDEIELVADLVIAASTSDLPLTPEQIDQALGVHR